MDDRFTMDGWLMIEDDGWMGSWMNGWMEFGDDAHCSNSLANRYYGVAVQ